MSGTAWKIDADLLGLEDNVAIVTGGGGPGMGGQHCRLLARAGCNIVVADVDEEGGRGTVSAVEEIGRRAIFVRTNARDEDAVQEMVRAAYASFGRLAFGS